MNAYFYSISYTNEDGQPVSFDNIEMEITAEGWDAEGNVRDIGIEVPAQSVEIGGYFPQSITVSDAQGNQDIYELRRINRTDEVDGFHFENAVYVSPAYEKAGFGMQIRFQA